MNSSQEIRGKSEKPSQDVVDSSGKAANQTDQATKNNKADQNLSIEFATSTSSDFPLTSQDSYSKEPKPKPSMMARLSSLIDYEQMSALHEAFLDRWQGQDQGLTKEEFKAAVKKTVGLRLGEDEVDRIFKQMDTRDSGRMRWCDYIGGISRTAQLRSYMADRDIKPLFQDKMTFIRTRHRDEVVSIRFMPRLSLQSTKIDYKSGRYLMLGRQGHISIWTLSLSLMGTHYIGASEGLNPLYFVDMVVMYPSTLIAVTSTDRKIVLYELGSRGIQEKYSIVTLGNCVTCLDFWSDLCSRTTSLLVWGDTAGDIHALELNVNRLGGIFEKDQNQEIISRVGYADLVKNKFPAVRLHRAAAVHDDWVTAVKYIPENKAFLSSSRSSNKQSMLYSDWNGKVESRYFLSNKAVLCFDYNHVINILVTGSLDCRVRVWNFFMGQRPVSTLTGHSSPITRISINPSTQHVISIDKSRAVKIFDYLEGTVIQSFSGPSLECMGKRTEITGFFFNLLRSQLILATTVLATVTKRTNPSYMAEISAHDFPISAVCYSSAFSEILTACTNGQISVWDVHSGKHVLQFSHFSSRSQFKDLPWAKDNTRLEVTAMAMDSDGRSLLTGSNDGTVNLWNFSTGVLLTHYTLPDNGLVTGLCMDRNHIYATGWFKHVYLLDLAAKGNARPKCFARYHTEEINCMTLIRGGLLATGSYDGDVIIVSKDTGHPVAALNAAISEFPRAMRGTSDENDAQGLDNLAGDDKDETSSSFSGWSDDELITTEDHSILRCIRISDDLVMVSNAVTGDAMRIIKKPRAPKAAMDKTLPIYDALKGCNVSVEESAANFKAYESSVEAIIFLDTRKHLDANTANLMTAGAEGWIRAWSLNQKGGLKGQFLATEYLGEAVKAFATDRKNDFLITGDTRGYVKVWDIMPYCNASAKKMASEERQERRDRFIRQFLFLRSPFLRDKAAEGFKQCQEFHKRRPPEVSNPQSTLRTPYLLNVFRAHIQSITCLEYINEHDTIITGGKDCSVRLWNLRGSFVGQCGCPWVRLPDSQASLNNLRVLPRDLRRNGSARTLRIIKSGCVPLWDRAMQCVRNYLEEQRKEQFKKAELEAQKAQAKETGEVAEESSEETESIMTQPLPLGPEENDLPEELRLVNVVNFNWQDPKKSRILGKSFKPNLHHRTILPVNVEDEFGMFPAYRQVKVVDINHVARIPTPQLVNDMEIRRKEEEEEAQKFRQQLARRKSKWIPKQKALSAKGQGHARRSSNTSNQEIFSGTESSLACSPHPGNSCSANANANAGELLAGVATSPDAAQNQTRNAIEVGKTQRHCDLDTFFITEFATDFLRFPKKSWYRKKSKSTLSNRKTKRSDTGHGVFRLKQDEDLSAVEEDTESEELSDLVSPKAVTDIIRDEKSSRTRRGCLLPPLTAQDKPLHNRREPKARSPTKLPLLQTQINRKSFQDFMKGTGLWYRRK